MWNWLRLNVFEPMGLAGDPNETVNACRLDAVRRTLEGEAEADEADFVRARIQSDPLWRQTARTLEAMLKTLRGLPLSAPSNLVWNRVGERIAPVGAGFSWTAWSDGWLLWPRAFRLAPAALAAFTLFCVWWAQPEVRPTYEIVEITDSHGFGAEAEAYIAYHDLSSESTPMREGLIAYYTYNWSE
ncbi:MAG: hypothetical protein GC154_12340 [bacterium]|nr:hypothetical protein [bacterium]